jgi:hypothetical protein
MNVTLLQYPSKTDIADIVPGNTTVKSITQTSNKSHYSCGDINLLKMKRNMLYTVNQFVLHCKHFPPVIKTNQLMTYRANVCSEICIKRSKQSKAKQSKAPCTISEC